MTKKKSADTSGAVAKSAESPAVNRKKRSTEIISALSTCMLRNGYDDTRLTDIANEAGITVSHLLYYYSGMDEILLHLAQDLHQRVLNSVNQHRDDPPEERIHRIVHNMFIGISHEENALMREIVGLAPHKPALQVDSQKFTAEMTGHFKELFERTPRQPGMSAADAAELAGSMWIGLMIQTAFQSHIEEASIRGLFRKGLLMLANFGGV